MSPDGEAFRLVVALAPSSSGDGGPAPTPPGYFNRTEGKALHSGKKYPGELEGQRPSSGDIGHPAQMSATTKRLAAAAAQLLHPPSPPQAAGVSQGRSSATGCARSVRRSAR